MCNATCTSSHISQQQSIVMLFVMPVKHVYFDNTNNEYIPGQTNINFDLFSLYLFLYPPLSLSSFSFLLLFPLALPSISFLFVFHVCSVCVIFSNWNLQSKAFFLTPELAFCCQLMNAAITSKEKPTPYANPIPANSSSSSSKNFCYSISVETTATSTATAVSSMLIIDTMSFCC